MERFNLSMIFGDSDDGYPAAGVFSDSGCNSPAGEGSDVDHGDLLALLSHSDGDEGPPAATIYTSPESDVNSHGDDAPAAANVFTSPEPDVNSDGIDGPIAHNVYSSLESEEDENGEDDNGPVALCVY
jgi:hypothetical protein